MVTATGDPSDLLTVGDVAVLLVGLLPVERRQPLVSKVSENNPLLGAKCVTACFSVDTALQETATNAALHTIEEIDSVHKGNQGLLALIELGHIETAITQLLQVRITGKWHVDVIVELLSCDDGSHVNAYFDALNPANKKHHKLLLMTALSLQSRLLHDEQLRKRVSDFGRYLVNAHHYTELKALARRPGFVLDIVLGRSVEEFVAQLIEDSSHKATKHQRLGLALDIIKRRDLEAQFPLSEIVLTILRDNRTASDLPNRSQLLKLARILMEKQCSLEHTAKYIQLLIGAPGIESIELAIDLIAKCKMTETFTVESAIREFLKRRLKRGEADKVKQIIVERSLSAIFPDFQFLGEVLEGKVTKVSVLSNKVGIRLDSIPRPCFMWLSDFVQQGDPRNPSEQLIGRSVKGTVVRIGSSGVELKRVK